MNTPSTCRSCGLTSTPIDDSSSGADLSSLCSCIKTRTEKDDEIIREIKLLDIETRKTLSEVADNIKGVLNIKDSDQKKIIPVVGPMFNQMLSKRFPKTTWINEEREGGVNGQGVFEYSGCRLAENGRYYDESGEEIIPVEMINTDHDLPHMDF